MANVGRNAIITGAAQGVGEAVARRFAADGFRHLILLDQQHDLLQGVATDLQGDGVGTQAITLDLTDVDKLCNVVGAVAEAAGEVHVLVNAAGTTARGGLSDIDPDTFNMIFAINVRAPMFMMQTVAPYMPRGATVVNICSMLAYGGPPFLLAYSSSKAALAALTKGAANSVKWNGVRAFGINLGWTWTPAEQIVQTQLHGMPENWREEIGAKQPFGRLLMPEDPAALTSFLVSDEAAMMTGAIIDLDQHVAGTVDDNPGNQ
ncbi:MAG: oxidoreductase [Pseudomonadota bacterium]